MENENTPTAKEPIRVTVTYTVTFTSMEAVAKDFVAAAKLINDLPSELATRRAASALFDNILSNAVTKVKRNGADIDSDEKSDEGEANNEKSLKQRIKDGDEVSVDELVE